MGLTVLLAVHRTSGAQFLILAQHFSFLILANGVTEQIAGFRSQYLYGNETYLRLRNEQPLSESLMQSLFA